MNEVESTHLFGYRGGSDEEHSSHDTDKQSVLFNTILEATFSGIYSLRAVRDAADTIIDFVYLFANNVIERLLQTNRHQLVGQSMLELIPENRTNGFFDLFCKVLSTGEPSRGESHFVTVQMNAWFNFIIQPVDRDTVVVTLQDITDLKNSALELEQQKNLVDNILKNSSNGISVTRMIRNPSGEVIDASTILANDAAVQFTGLPKDVYLKKTAAELDPNILQSEYGETCLRTLATGIPSMIQYQLEVTGRWLELTISKMDDDHLIHIFTDVTSIKKAENKMAEYITELRHSNSRLQQFAYAASHDLKEPIRKVQTFADRLNVSLKDKLTDEEKNYFQRMESAAVRMRSLIDDLLVFSNVSTVGNTTEPVDLNKVIRSVMEDLEIEIEEKRATMQIGELPTVRGDKRQLQQLFQNVISNALKYQRGENAAYVSISARPIEGDATVRRRSSEEKNRPYYLIQVTDNGIGFEPEHAEHIFGIFTRLHGNTEYKGSGVGLSIARQVAENHGGDIWAEGRPNAGATFNILLPAE